MSVTWSRSFRALVALALVGASSAITGCTHVAPYERGVLAGPTMTPDDMGSGIELPLFAEGADLA